MLEPQPGLKCCEASNHQSLSTRHEPRLPFASRLPLTTSPAVLYVLNILTIYLIYGNLASEVS